MELKGGEFKTKEKSTTELVLFSNDQKTYPDDSIWENKMKNSVSIADHKTHEIVSPATSTERKGSSTDTNKTQAEEAKNISLDPYLTNETFLEKLEVLFFDFKNLFTELSSIQKIGIGLCIFCTPGFLTYDYILAFFRWLIRISLRRSSKTFSLNDALALLTLSSMVYSHLQNLADGIKASNPEEDLEKYLTEEFLKKVSGRIAEDYFMRSNFQELLTAEALLRLGKFHYQMSQNSSETNQVSSYVESSEIVTHHCMGNPKDVKVKLNVKIGGQEL